MVLEGSEKVRPFQPGRLNPFRCLFRGFSALLVKLEGDASITVQILGSFLLGMFSYPVF